jgi:hypothetical protein
MFLNKKSRSSDRMITLIAALACPLPEKSKLSEDFQFRDAKIAAAAVIVCCLVCSFVISAADGEDTSHSSDSW